MEPEEAARIRAEKIAKSQELLKEAANSLDKKLYEKLLENLDAIAADASSLEQLFREFQATEHAKVLQQFTRGVLEIGSLNASYFEAVADNLDKKDFAALKSTAQETLLNRFGLDSTGRAKKGWFIDSFINDTSIPRSIRKQAIKWQASGTGLNQFKQDLKSLVLAEGNGVYSKYYNTYAYDTYQQADATIQQHYAKKLGLKAYLYSGGLMTSSRSFCTSKNGKVFTDEEVAAWKDDVFTGKPKEGYNPFIDRGGYNCRHHLNAITAKMAAARRSDLEVDEAGNLVKKGTGKPVADVKPEVPQDSFTPAKSIEEAEAFAAENLKTKIETFKGYDLEVANQINKTLFETEAMFKEVPVTKIGTKVSGKAYAQYDWNDNTLHLRKRYADIEARRISDNDIWRKQYNNDYHTSTTLDGTIKHEFAHAFDNLTGRKLYKELETLPLPVKNELYGISGYASSNRFYATGGATQGSEMIAEVIAAKLTKNPKYAALPEPARLIIDKYFN